MIFNSFLPTDGYIKSVVIYPSDFGLKTMEEESRIGPNVWKSKGKDDDGEDGFDLKKLRTYEINKLKYYFAVVECNSINTASKLYKALNDSEIENTANKLDLRFIPEHISFEGRQIKDSASSLPETYQAPFFETKALQSTKPELTWDQLPVDRVSVTQKRFTKEQIREMDFQAYLADDSSDESGDEKREKYSNLLGDLGGDDDIQYEDDMEIVFTEANVELDEKVKELVDKKNNENRTVFDEYMDKQRKKKREKRLAKKNMKEELSASEDSDEEQSEEVKPKKTKRRKRKLEEDGEVEKETTVDLSDERIKRLITDPRFHIDPTHPRYKKSKTNQLILKERQKHRKRVHK